MDLPGHKTKIVCATKPASQSPEVMRHTIEAGIRCMNDSIRPMSQTHGRRRRPKR